MFRTTLKYIKDFLKGTKGVYTSKLLRIIKAGTKLSVSVNNGATKYMFIIKIALVRKKELMLFLYLFTLNKFGKCRSPPNYSNIKNLKNLEVYENGRLFKMFYKNG